MYVQWNPGARFGDPPPEVQARGFWWKGDHRSDGILICKGPGIRSAASLNTPVVYDLVPTLMHLAGLPAPPDLDGRVIEELCEDDFRASHPLRLDSSEGSVQTDDAALSDSEQQMVEEKLRSLGYL